MRRRSLACTAVALLPGAARAFRLEPAAPELAAAYAGGACRDTALHAAIQAEVEAAFGPAPLPEAVEKQLATLPRCPFCGCGLGWSPDPQAAD